MKKLEEEEGMAGGAAAQVAAPSPGLWRRVYGASGWAGPEPVGRDVPHPGAGRRRRRQPGDDRRRRGWRQSFAAARDRWVLLGEQHCARGLELWRTARGALRWTQQADDCVRFVAGRGCCSQDETWSAPVVCDFGGLVPPADMDGSDDVLTSMFEGLILVTEGAMEGEVQLRVAKAQVDRIRRSTSELAAWAPLLLDFHVEHRARGTSRAASREARWRAEGLAETARAAEAKLQASAAAIEVAARSAELVRAAMAEATVECWRAKPADIGVCEEVLVCDLLVLVVAGLATALGEMVQCARKPLQYCCCQRRLWLLIACPVVELCCLQGRRQVVSDCVGQCCK